MDTEEVNQISEEINRLIAQFNIEEQDREDVFQEAWVARLQDRDVKQVIYKYLEIDRARKAKGL